MFNLREYLITIAAVFLALALGILIGVSFGDGFLAANQRDVIQLMEVRLSQLREDLELRETELQRWESLKPAIRNHFSGALAGTELFLICRAGQEYEFIETALEEAGAAVTVALAPESQNSEGGEGRRGAGADEIAGLLTGPGHSIEALAEAGLLFPGGRPPLPLAPAHLCLLLLEPPDFTAGGLLSDLAAALHEQGNRVIFLLPWLDGEFAGPRAERESAFGLVDNIDTFWGQIALLKMIAGNSGGHYGFGKDSSGLIPAQGPGD